MRDGEIYAMQQVNARRDALILSQWEFLETRQRAFELVVKDSGFWSRVRYFFSPKAFIEAVDARQLSLLQEAKIKRDAAMDKAREEMRKPKIIMPAGVNGHG